LDQTKFTTIAHRDHAICNPIGIEKTDRVLALLDLPPGARVLDVGCGKAEMLMRLIERYGCAAVGVDSNPHFLAEARARAFDRGVAGQLELHESEIAKQKFESESFDAALCVGATHAYGDYGSTLEALRGLVKPGGKVLVGEGHWMRRPEAAYLKALGAKAKDYTDHTGNVTAGVEAHLTYLYSAVADTDDLDHYEGLYNRAVETWCLENPDDSDHTAARKKIRDWRDLYLQWGRDTLGFALYLFQK
jgi:cyclopropane fatty-acyl-phospholipid synthase-like methyltransferase